MKKFIESFEFQSLTRSTTRWNRQRYTCSFENFLCCLNALKKPICILWYNHSQWLHIHRDRVLAFWVKTGRDKQRNVISGFQFRFSIHHDEISKLNIQRDWNSIKICLNKTFMNLFRQLNFCRVFFSYFWQHYQRKTGCFRKFTVWTFEMFRFHSNHVHEWLHSQVNYFLLCWFFANQVQPVFFLLPFSPNKIFALFV